MVLHIILVKVLVKERGLKVLEKLENQEIKVE